jgi:hypothetical protein
MLAAGVVGAARPAGAAAGAGPGAPAAAAAGRADGRATDLAGAGGAAPGDRASLDARVALERSKRPDLAGGPSAREKTIAHQAAMQIPERELAGLSTPDLIQKIMGTSLTVVMLEGSAVDGGLATLKGIYNGVPALLERKDAGPELVKTLDRMVQKIPTLSKETDKATAIENGKFSLSFPVVEILLSSDPVLNTLNDTEKKNLVGLVLRLLEVQKAFDAKAPVELFSQSKVEWDGLLVARVLDRLNVPEYRAWLKRKEGTGLFTTRSITGVEGLEVLQLARELKFPAN